MSLSGLVAVLAFVGTVEDAVRAEEDRWAQPRAAMVSTIQAHAASLPQAVDGHGISPAVLDVMGKVPRHRFVPEGAEREAYADMPLPIGHGQTISQPFIVALMTHLAKAGPDRRCSRSAQGPATRPPCSRRWLRPSARSRSSPNSGRRHPPSSGSRLRQRPDKDRRWLYRMAGVRPFRWDSGDRRRRPCSAAPCAATQARRPHGDPGRQRLRPPIPDTGREDEDGQVTSRQILSVRFVPLTREAQ